MLDWDYTSILIEMIEISSTFAKNVFEFELRIIEKEKCGKRFEICLFATIGETRERKESVVFLICQTGLWRQVPQKREGDPKPKFQK